MKKIISVLLSLVLLLGVVMNMSSCGLATLTVGSIVISKLFTDGEFTGLDQIFDAIFDDGRGENIIAPDDVSVSMYWAEGTEDPDSTAWQDASSGSIFGRENWEPGLVAARHVQVFNESSLAFIYRVTIEAKGEPSMLTDVIDVYVIDSAAQITDSEKLTDDMKVGTLSQVLEGSAVLVGVLSPEDAARFTIVLKMQEDAGNEYQMPLGAELSVVIMADPIAVEGDYGFDEYKPMG